MVSDLLRTSNANSQKRPLVVVVDDNVDAADSLKTLLQLHGCQVYAAFDGQAGLEAIKVLRPQLVIADLNMPKLDGRELVALARRIEPRIDATFVCLSAAPRSLEETACLQAGFDAYLQKPLTVEALRVLIGAASG